MTIMRMTDIGIEKFTTFLNNVKSNTAEVFPTELLVEGDYAEAIGGDSSWLDDLNLNDKLETARELHAIVALLELRSAERDIGFWTWCSAYLFDRLCKRKANKRKPGEIAIWIPQVDNWKRYYRHYLSSIWRVYLAHREDDEKLIALLNGHVNTPGELWAQIASVQLLITNSSIIDVIHHLYWDKTKNSRKKGAGGESPRRLRTVLKQFECTWDFFNQSSDQIVAMLPSEFDRFKELDDLDVPA